MKFTKVIALLFILCAVPCSANDQQVVTPSFCPASGVYNCQQSVSISSTTSGATIAYTTDGSIPTESGGSVAHGTLYSGAVSLTANTTLSAIAFEASYIDSSVYIGGYTLPAATPTFSPAAGDFTSTQSVDVSAIPFSQTPTLNVLYNFTVTNTTLGNPAAALVQGTDGNFYGTAHTGSPVNGGGVFKMTPAGIFTTLVLFNGTDGWYSDAALVQGTDGNFYGTTEQGGSGWNNATGQIGDGTVFKITPSGTLTTLVSFTGANGAQPQSTLVQGTDGNFYGTTATGGSNNDGTVFKITPAGILTTLISFVGANGKQPDAGVIQGSDGNFYGTTGLGGSSNNGTVFKITPAGALTTLISFTGANGMTPGASLLQGSDGNFYGTTNGGGVNNNGTVFKITPSGTFTTLVSVNGTTNGANLDTPLVIGSDGNFYGTTDAGGSADDGTVFRMTPSGVLATLFSFSGTNGNSPFALLQGSDGNFYGTAIVGGTTGAGVIFQLIVPPLVAAPAFSPTAGTYTSAQTVTVTSATNGASIRYTTDGSTPTETNGTLYSNPVSISATTSLQAIAYATGNADSSVTNGTFTIDIATTTPPASTPPASSSSGGGGGGAPSYWFLGFLAFVGILKWKFRQTQARSS